MRTLTPIRWSEGMFLKPHHFQQADLYQDSRLAYHLYALDPFHWGVFKLKVDLDALENLVFRVEQCEVVLEDGLIVNYPDGALLDAASFQDAFPPTAEALGVYLAARRPSPDNGLTERFAARTESRRDLLMPDNAASVDFLVPRVKIVFAQRADDERLGGCEAIKIAEVRRTGLMSPRFEVSSRYIPPAMSLHAVPVLLAMVNRVLERCSAYSRVLGQHLRRDSVGYGVGDLENLLSRQMINQYIPALANGLLNESFHPYAVYGLLAELRGALTTYFPDEEAWSFPAYDHANLAGCFGPLCESISLLLERLGPTRYLQFKLHREEETATRKYPLFLSDLDQGLDSKPIDPAVVFARGQAFILALHSPIDESELRKRIGEQAKVSSRSEMDRLRVGLPGVPLKLLDHPPSEIPRIGGYLYYQIETGGPLFVRMKEEKSFAFSLVKAEPELEAHLFVVLRPESGTA